jgi:HPt (histidine-containing phosphotransfer) domain-containing protein
VCGKLHSSRKSGEVKIMANSKPAAIDADTIAALQEEGSLLRELRDLFVAEAAEQLNKMLEAYKQGDAHGIAVAAHRLKGSAVTFGAAEMQRRCLELEALAKSNSTAGVDSLIAELSAECERVQLSLDAALDHS